MTQLFPGRYPAATATAGLSRVDVRAELREAQINGDVIWNIVQGEMAKGNKPATVNRYLSTVRGLLRKGGPAAFEVTRGEGGDTLDIRVVAEATDGDAAMAGLQDYRPDVAIQLLGTVIVIDRIQHAGTNSVLSDD